VRRWRQTEKAMIEIAQDRGEDDQYGSCIEWCDDDAVDHEAMS